MYRFPPIQQKMNVISFRSPWAIHGEEEIDTEIFGSMEEDQGSRNWMDGWFCIFFKSLKCLELDFDLAMGRETIECFLFMGYWSWTTLPLVYVYILFLGFKHLRRIPTYVGKASNFKYEMFQYVCSGKTGEDNCLECLLIQRMFVFVLYEAWTKSDIVNVCTCGW